MGKSSTKSASKVDAALAVVTPAKSAKKGNKREAENVAEKVVISKKQKKDESVEQAALKKKVEAKIVKKKVESSSSDESSDSEDEKPAPVAAKKPVAAKNGKADSSSDSDESSDEEVKPAVAAKKVPVPAAKNGKVDSDSSDEDSSDESSDEEPKKATKAAPAKKAAAPAAKKAESSDSDSDSSESEDEKPAPVKKAPVAAAPKKDSSDSSEEESSDEEEAPKAAAPKKAEPAKKAEESSEEDSDSDESEDEPAKTVAKPVKAAEASSDSDEESDDESSDEDEKPAKTPKKADNDVIMLDAETPKQKQAKTPATPATGGTKTLFVGNMSFKIERSDLENFFKDAGEIVDVRFATDREDDRFKGFGHVEFGSAEEAQEALKLNGSDLLGRPVRLDLARERGERGERPAYTPNSGGSSFQQRGKTPSGQTVFVKGFDSYQGEDEIKTSLQQHFGGCGEITRISIPTDRDTGAVKGMAYMDFGDSSGFSKALEMNGSQLGEAYLHVDEAKPRDNFNSGSFSNGRGRGGRSSDGGGRRGRGGRFGDSGGRFGDSGGRFGRGRGRTPSKPSFSGKKTTFDD